MRAPAVPVSGSVVAWAIEEAGYTDESVASRLHVPVEELERWLTGEDGPTPGQFRRLARILRRPSAVFLLPEPPRSTSVVAAFRRAPGTAERDGLSPREAEAMRLARRRQSTVSELLADAGATRVEIPQLDAGQEPETAAERLREWVGVGLEEQFAWETESQALSGWREGLERRGLLVFLLSLGRGAVRGFSVHDRFAPLLVANTTGYRASARIFTWWHELGHLARGGDGVCDRYYLDRGPEIERWCERLGAAAILPREAFLAHVSEELGYEPGDRAASLDEAGRIARRFNASVTATAVRLINLELAPTGLYEELLVVDRPSRGGGGGGETRPEKRLRELGAYCTSVLVESWSRGELPLHELLDVLDIKTTDLPRLEESLVSDQPG